MASDGDLVDGHQAAAQMRRGDLGDIHGGGHGGDTDADTPEPAEQDKGPDVLRQRRADRGAQEKPRRQEQGLLASKPIRDGPDDQHPGRAPDQHAPRRPALHHHVEVEPSRQKLNGPGNDPRVIAEEQPAQRGH